MPKKAKKRTAKKRTPRKKFPDGYCNKDLLKIKGLSVYYITGSIKVAAKESKCTTKTIYDWLNRPKIVEAAKEIANDHLDAKCARIVELTYQGIVEKIDTKAKRKKVSPEAMNRMLGTALDKLVVVRGLNKSLHEHTGKDGKPIEMTFVFGTANLKKQEQDNENS